jgi:integrase
LYGLRRSELLALRWDDIDARACTVRIDEGLIGVSGGIAWSEGKTARSRRTIPVDQASMDALTDRRRAQVAERLQAGSGWEHNDLVIATATGRPVVPRNFDHTLRLVVERAGVRRLTSHGLRHTAATHMVAGADDVGELRAAAEVLGHSPDLLLRIYAHTVPESLRTLTDKVGRRGG